MSNIVGNGCGKESWPVWIKDLLFNWFFEASCNIHDQGYQEGGDEARRKVCDDKFLAAMLRDVKTQLPLLLKPIGYTTAYSYYAAVRLGGKGNFKYK